MPRLSWSDFLHAHPRCHLVAAVLPEGEELGSPEVKEGRNLLLRKIGQLMPSGAYAVTIVRGAGPPQVHCVFANEGDAAAFASAMKADVVESYVGYASQRLFRLGDAASSALSGALPPPRLSAKRRREQAEQRRPLPRGRPKRRRLASAKRQ
jgi:hypothetical protein